MMKSSDGFSLLEALAGVLVISTVVLVAAPPIILSASNRLQNQRAEQAGQIATAEVDRIRTQVLEGNYTTGDLPPSAALNTDDITSVPAPTGVDTSHLRSNNTSCANVSPTPVAATQLLRVDSDGSCQPAFLVQVFRDDGLVVPGTKPVVMMFRLGVRVYSIQAFQNNALALLSPATCARFQFGNGLGEQPYHPLAVAYTTISRSEISSFSLEDYKNYVSIPKATPSVSPCG